MGLMISDWDGPWSWWSEIEILMILMIWDWDSDDLDDLRLGWLMISMIWDLTFHDPMIWEWYLFWACQLYTHGLLTMSIFVFNELLTMSIFFFPWATHHEYFLFFWVAHFELVFIFGPILIYSSIGVIYSWVRWAYNREKNPILGDVGSFLVAPQNHPKSGFFEMSAPLSQPSVDQISILLYENVHETPNFHLPKPF